LSEFLTVLKYLQNDPHQRNIAPMKTQGTSEKYISDRTNNYSVLVRFDWISVRDENYSFTEITSFEVLGNYDEEDLSWLDLEYLNDYIF